MFSWDSAEVHQITMKQMFPEKVIGLSLRFPKHTQNGNTALNHDCENRLPGEPSSAEKNGTPEPRENVAIPIASSVAYPTTSYVVDTPGLPVRSRNPIRMVNRNIPSLHERADEEMNNWEKDATGRESYVDPNNHGGSVRRSDAAIREDLLQQEHRRQWRSQTVQSGRRSTATSSTSDLPPSPIQPFITKAFEKEEQAQREAQKKK